MQIRKGNDNHYQAHMYKERGMFGSFHTETKAALCSICIIVRQNYSHRVNIICDGSFLWIFVVREGLYGMIHCYSEYNVNNN